MGTRERMLPGGWYPNGASGCRAEIEQFVAGVTPRPAGARIFGGIVPHAGWYFSGKAAARVFDLSARASQPQVVVVFGGHLGADSPPLLVSDEAWETPLGTIPLATEFYQPLKQRLSLGAEYPGDNTIEVQLPMVKYFFPNAKVLALRSPSSPTALKLGKAVAAVALELNLSLLAFGSTDLTHYGPNYGWAPRGMGAEAVRWVREVNDQRFLSEVLQLDGAGLLRAAQEDRSACSAGGAAAALAAAKSLGAQKAVLLDYYTSYEIMPADSFVGYAGILLEG